MEWYRIDEKAPPQDRVFLCDTEWEVQSVKYKGLNAQGEEMYVGTCSCNCCPHDGCTLVFFKYWCEMPYRRFNTMEELFKDLDI